MAPLIELLSDNWKCIKDMKPKYEEEIKLL